MAAAACYREYAGGKAPQGLEALTVCRPRAGGSAKRWRVVGLDQSMDASASDDGLWMEV